MSLCPHWPDECTAVTATLHWDFWLRNFRPHVHIHGSMDFDCVDQALDVCEMMNETYGEGSHWIVPGNMSKVEMAELAVQG